MTDKPSFVDTIEEATRQSRRRLFARTAEPAAKVQPRMSNWPPPRQRQWRLELFKSWRRKD